MSTRANPTDTVGVLLAALLVAVFLPVVLCAITSVGIAGAFLTILVCWFLGRPQMAWWLLGVAAAILVGAISQFHAERAWLSLYESYRVAIVARDLHIALYAWLRPTPVPAELLGPFAVGIVVGTVAVVRAETKRVARDQLLERGVPRQRRRSPVALLRLWLNSRRPPHSKSGSLLGTEFYEGASVYVTNRELNNHAIVIGTTGAGKTQTSLNLIESAIVQGIPVVCIDGKGDELIAQRIRAFALVHGRKFYHFNAANVGESDVYNPLSHGDFTSKADRILAVRPKWTEPHHESLATGFMQMTFKILDHEGISTDLVSTSRYMSSASLLSLLRRKGHADTMRVRLAAEVGTQQEAEKTSISSLKADVNNLAQSSLGSLFDTETARRLGKTVFNLVDARRECAVVYYSLPGLLFPKTAATLGRLVINDLKAATSIAKTPYLLAFEEISVYPAPQVHHLLSMGRSHGVMGIILSQSLNDLVVCLPEQGNAFAEQIFASVNTFIFHRLNSAADADIASMLIGTNAEIEHTAQTLSGAPTGATSSRLVRAFRFHPDDIKSLKMGEALVLNKNAGTAKKVIVRLSKI